MSEAEYREKTYNDNDGVVEIRGTEVPDGFIPVDNIDTSADEDKANLYKLLETLSDKEIAVLQAWAAERAMASGREDSIRGAVSGQE